MINDVKNLKESGGASIEELRAFLKTLKAPPDATPLRDPGITKLAKR